MRICLIIVCLLLLNVRSGICQDRQDYIFVSYQNYLPTPKIGIIDFYRQLNEKWKRDMDMVNDEAHVGFEVYKDSTIRVVSSNFGHVDKTEEMNQKFSSISKWIPANKDGRSTNIAREYIIHLGERSSIGELGTYTRSKDTMVVIDPGHIQFIGGKWLNALYYQTLDYFYTNGRLKRIEILVSRNRNRFYGYLSFKEFEQFFVFYYGLPTYYDNSPSLAVKSSYFDLENAVKDSLYKLSWEDFRDGRISLTFDPEKVMVTYDFY